jgi:outer membrane protein assembly factor BamB
VPLPLGQLAPDAWFLTAFSLRTGKQVWSRYVGSGFLYNNHYAAVSLGPDGTAYVGTVGGLVRIADR